MIYSEQVKSTLWADIDEMAINPSKFIYRYVCKNVTFDYLNDDIKNEYPMQFRVVRFEVADGIYENIITNLPTDEFSLDEICQIYPLRWNIVLISA